MAKKTKAKRSKPARKNGGTLCDRMKTAATRVAGDLGYKITDLRCNVMSAMFVPGGKPERRTAFSFTIIGKDGR